LRRAGFPPGFCIHVLQLQPGSRLLRLVPPQRQARWTVAIGHARASHSRRRGTSEMYSLSAATAFGGLLL
jgi:hypothetical protein